jgi:hypothetical protein
MLKTGVALVLPMTVSMISSCRRENTTDHFWQTSPMTRQSSDSGGYVKIMWGNGLAYDV